MVKAIEFAQRLQDRVIQNDLYATQEFEREHIDRSIVYTRQDVVLLVALATAIEVRLKHIAILLTFLLLIFIFFILRSEHVIVL